MTRRKVLDAGTRAFAEKGLDGTNLVRDVLEPAGVSVGSFYHQFADKTELLTVLLDEALELARAAIDDAQQPSDPWTPLTVAADAYDRLLRMVDDHEDLVRIQLREASHPDPLVRQPLIRIREMWITSLSTGFRRLSSDDAVFDADLAAELVAALGNGILRHYLDLAPRARSRQRKRLIDGLARFTVSGFAGLSRPAP